MPCAMPCVMPCSRAILCRALPLPASARCGPYSQQLGLVESSACCGKHVDFLHAAVSMPLQCFQFAAPSTLSRELQASSHLLMLQWHVLSGSILWPTVLQEGRACCTFCDSDSLTWQVKQCSLS